MSAKFCANLNFLFTENSSGLLERYCLAAAAGFKGIEGPFPEDVPCEEISKTINKYGLQQTLLNIKLGKTPETKFGCTSLPHCVNEFKNHLQDTIEATKTLKCKKIHLMAGKVEETADMNKCLETYVNNLKYAAKILEPEGIVGVIEPINKYAVPGYFLNNYETAIDVLKKVNSPFIKLMVDVYHLQHICGNITNSLKDYMPYVGHIQIAQVPNRDEPSESGELNYRYVLNVIEELGYTDWIGCEYKPKDGTTNGLKWIKELDQTL